MVGWPTLVGTLPLSEPAHALAHRHVLTDAVNAH